MKGYSIEYKLVTSNYSIEYKVVTSFILHLEYKWSIVLQSRHTRGGGINIIYSIASIMVYQRPICSRRRIFTTFFTAKRFFHFRKLPTSVFDLMNSSIIQHLSNASLLDVSVYLDFVSFDMTSFRLTNLKVLAFFVFVPCFASMSCKCRVG